MSKKITQAIMLTGAAARISQEVALIDKLREKKGLKISEENTLVTGFSSGSLNLLAINGCFRKNNPISWEEDYKKNTLFCLTNGDVFEKATGRRLYIFSTDPLRQTLNKFLGLQKVKYVSDFSFFNYVLTFSDRKLTTEWAANIENTQNNLVLSDLFMASTAIPIVFPAQKIGNKALSQRNFPKGHFSDGGTGGTFDKFADYIGKFVTDNQAFDDLYIISPMRESDAKEHEHLTNGISANGENHEEHESLKDFASKISFNTFMKFLKKLQEWNNENGPIAKNIYVNIPKLESNFGILDFNQEKTQYDTVCDWVEKNPDDFAVPLDKYIAEHERK